MMQGIVVNIYISFMNILQYTFVVLKKHFLIECFEEINEQILERIGRIRPVVTPIKIRRRLGTGIDRELIKCNPISHPQTQMGKKGTHKN